MTPSRRQLDGADATTIDFDAVARAVLQDYQLPPYGIHGVAHWGRVLENGLRLAKQTGADPRVVVLFALFHDSRRVNENTDPAHGQRGAQLAASLRGQLFELPDREFQLLHHACALHTDGLMEGDVTVLTCWDADRLDLARVGIRPQPERLCTKAARDPDLLCWAIERGESETVPECLLALWEELVGDGRP